MDTLVPSPALGLTESSLLSTGLFITHAAAAAAAAAITAAGSAADDNDDATCVVYCFTAFSIVNC